MRVVKTMVVIAVLAGCSAWTGCKSGPQPGVPIIMNKNEFGLTAERPYKKPKADVAALQPKAPSLQSVMLPRATDSIVIEGEALRPGQELLPARKPANEPAKK